MMMITNATSILLVAISLSFIGCSKDYVYADHSYSDFYSKASNLNGYEQYRDYLTKIKKSYLNNCDLLNKSTNKNLNCDCFEQEWDDKIIFFEMAIKQFYTSEGSIPNISDLLINKVVNSDKSFESYLDKKCLKAPFSLSQK